MAYATIFNRCLIAAALVFPAIPAGGPWDKVPQEWNLSETYQILRDSPWSPAKVKLDAIYTQRHTDPQTGIVSDSPVNPQDTKPVRGVEISRSKPLPSISVLWWSSRTIRLAKQRLRQLRSQAAPAQLLRADDLPDYVLVIEGSEPLRILRDAREDLHDTVFLELDAGTTVDLANVRFLDANADEDARTEFHFPRQIDGHATLDPNSERVVFHCKASAKNPRPGRQNSLSLRAEFEPRSMRAHGQPDL